MSKDRVVGALGAIVLFVGAFLPIFSVPIAGSVNYFRNGTGDGQVIVVIAIISLVLVLLRKTKWLSVPGLISFGFLFRTFIDHQLALMIAEAGCGDELARRTQLEWGWPALVVGSGLLITASLLSTDGLKLKSRKSVVTLVTALLVVLSVSGYFISGYTSARGQIEGGELPSEAYARLFHAVKSKNTEAISKEMSKKTLDLARAQAARQNISLEKVLENGFTATTFASNLPEMRDDRINCGMGAVEVYNQKDRRWEDLPFIWEEGSMKLAVGDLFADTWKSPGTGRALKEQMASNSAGNNLVPMAPNVNMNVKPVVPKQIPEANAKR